MQLGDTLPALQSTSQLGPIDVNAYIAESWAVIFSLPGAWG